MLKFFIFIAWIILINIIDFKITITNSITNKNKNEPN